MSETASPRARVGQAGTCTLPVLMAAAALVLGGCESASGAGPSDGGATLDTLVVAVTPWPGTAPIYVAGREGFLAREGLAVEIVPVASGNLGLEAMLAGEVDLALAGETPIVKAVLQKRPVSILATVAEADRAIRIVARRGQGLESASDLEGRTVCLMLGSTAEFFLDLYLMTRQVDPSLVCLRDCDPAESVRAVLDGTAAAASLWVPHSEQLIEALGAEAMVLDDPALYRMTWNLLARPEVASECQELIRALLRALIEAEEVIAEKPERARRILAEATGLGEGLLAFIWDDYQFTTRLDQSLVVALEDQARWLIGKEQDESREVPNFLHAIQTDPLEAVRPRSVTIVGR